MVMPNLYGSIVNNVLAGVIGTRTIIPGVVIGDDYAIFE
jgi:isocitrate dehydrogenase (NAD+)